MLMMAAADELWGFAFLMKSRVLSLIAFNGVAIKSLYAPPFIELEYKISFDLSNI